MQGPLGCRLLITVFKYHVCRGYLVVHVDYLLLSSVPCEQEPLGCRLLIVFKNHVSKGHLAVHASVFVFGCHVS